MRLPTISALDRARVCPGSAVLPVVGEVSPGMTAGTTAHLYLQRCNEAGREKALAELPEEARAVCGAIDLEGLPLDRNAYAAEVAFAYNVDTDTARELGRGLERDYSAADRTREIVGTADVVALVSDDGVFVADWKSEHAPTPPLRNNLQLKTYALAAARAYGRERAVIEIIRPREDGAWRERAELDMFDLADVAAELRDLVADVRAAAADMPVLTTGAHCGRCRSIRFCPAQTSMIRDLADLPRSEGALIARWEAELTPATAAAAWHKLKAIEAFTEKAWAALEGFAMQSDVDLGDGRVYGKQEIRRESIVGPVAWRVLEELFGSEVAWQAAEVKVTKAALERLVEGRLVKGQKKTHVVRDLLAKIDGAGGLKAKTQEEIRVHRRKA